MTFTRRGFVATGVAGIVGVAGCLGDDGGVDEDELLEVPVAGDPDADVTVTVYEDFACPACGQFKMQTYPTIQSEYIEPELIRYEHRDFPLDSTGDWSEYVASAARSIQEHDGDEAFFEFTSQIYQYQENYSFDAIEDVATEIGVDGERVRADAEDVTYADGLEADFEYGREQGVEGTPTVFVDGDTVDWSPTEAVTGAIDDALQ